MRMKFEKLAMIIYQASFADVVDWTRNELFGDQQPTVRIPREMSYLSMVYSNIYRQNRFTL